MKKISHERRVYEWVDDESISQARYISKFDGKIVSGSNGLRLQIFKLTNKIDLITFLQKVRGIPLDHNYNNNRCVYVCIFPVPRIVATALNI